MGITLGKLLFIVIKKKKKSECYNYEENKWFRYDDELVREIDIKSQNYETKGSETAYILFYEKFSTK